MSGFKNSLRQQHRAGFYTTGQLRLMNWSKNLVLKHIGCFKRYYIASEIDQIMTTPEWIEESRQDKIRDQIKQENIEAHKQKLITGELLSESTLLDRGWSKRQISQVPREQRTPAYIAQLEEILFK